MSDSHTHHPDSLLRLAEVRRIVPLSSTSIYRLIQAGDFPPPVQIGPRASAWRWSDLTAWIDSRQPSAGPTRAA